MGRCVLTLLCLAIWLVPNSSLAVTLKIATVSPDGIAWMKEMRKSADRIEELTEGRVKLKFYPGGVMGSSDTVMRKMRVGQLQGGAFTGGELGNIYSDFFLYSIPFLFRDDDEVQYVRSRMDRLLAEGLERKGMVLLGLSGGGFVYLMSDHPVNTIDDLVASRVWVPERDPISEMSLRLAGVAPIPIPLADVYTALQTGVIDTVLNTPVGAIAFQWHTRTRYVTDFPVAYVVGSLAVDVRSFSRLSAEDQEILRNEVSSTFATLDEINEKDNVGARGALMNQGITYLKPSVEQLMAWRKIGEETLTKLRVSDMEFESLEKLVEILQDYRNKLAKSQ